MLFPSNAASRMRSSFRPARRSRRPKGCATGSTAENQKASGGGGPKQKATRRELDGLIVDVELTEFPRPGVQPRGRVIEILGRRDEFGVDVEIMIRKHHLPHRFPDEVLAEAADTPQFISESEHPHRRDFRSLPVVTIDGETAKDFDDAVYVERLDNGHYLLQVHIADVAHYVRPASALDREARLRGNSVYFPDRAVPMLPLELSNGICSLNPYVDRLVMSALMEIDRQGRHASIRDHPGNHPQRGAHDLYGGTGYSGRRARRLQHLWGAGSEFQADGGAGPDPHPAPPRARLH